MTDKEFIAKQHEMLARIPEAFHDFFHDLAWEEGHSSGYEEVLNCLSNLLDLFPDALKKYNKPTITVLKETEQWLLDENCTFWACEGPDAPFQDMKTCGRCQTIHEIRKTLKNLS